MIKRFKAWLASFHKWRYIPEKEVRICKCCGTVEKYYELESAYWWGVVHFGDRTKPCFKEFPFMTPPY